MIRYKLSCTKAGSAWQGFAPCSVPGIIRCRLFRLPLDLPCNSPARALSASLVLREVLTVGLPRLPIPPHALSIFVIGQIILRLDLFLTFPPFLEHMPCEARYDECDGEDDEEELLHDVLVGER